MTATLVTMYEKGAITAEHLVVESLSMLDPANPGLILEGLSKDLLQRTLNYAREYMPGKMRTNYGHQPTVEQIQAAKQWIESKTCSSSGGGIDKADYVMCANCTKVLDEPVSTPHAQRQPCPICGSTARNFTMSASCGAVIVFGGLVTLTVTNYPQCLLNIAQTLIDQGHYNIAVVTSHMACEIAAERAFDAAYAAKGLQSFGDAIDRIMNGHNLGNEKHRDIYNALTGVTIQSEPFWSRFATASQKRNSIVHKGQHATKAEAEAALQAATELIAYLKQ